ncbi:MAG: oligosaccharide flippase family protein [Terriglobia bacterium]
MNLKLNALKGIGTGWLRLGVSLLVGFLLLPFILHHLGDSAFGLYVLIFSITGYYGVLDFGIKSSLGRYVAKFNATGDTDELNRFLSTVFTIYCIIAVLLLVLTFVGAIYVDTLFHISPDFFRSARLLFLITGTAIALGFPLGIFPGALYTLQRFATCDLASIATVAARAALIVWALTHGLGLLTVAIVTVSCNILFSLICMFFLFRTMVVRLSWKLANKKSLRLMITYSLPAFVMSISEQMRFYSAEILIGFMFSAAHITYFSIASKLVDYANRLTTATSAVFTSISSHAESTGDVQILIRILDQGSRVCALIVFPVCVLFITLGKPIIHLWMGARYVSSYPILVILIVPMTLYLAQAAAVRLLFGIGRHSWLAVASVAEGVAVIVLAILLGAHKGLIGIAWGVGIPLGVSSIVFYPVYTCRILKTSLAGYVRHAYLPPLLLCLPLIGTLVFLRRMLPAITYGTLALQLACGGVVYGGLFLWYFFTWEPLGAEVAGRIGRYFTTPEGPGKIDN